MSRRNWNVFVIFEGVEVRASWVDSMEEARATDFWVERESVVESMREWIAESWRRADRGIIGSYNTFNGVKWLFDVMTGVTQAR